MRFTTRKGFVASLCVFVCISAMAHAAKPLRIYAGASLGEPLEAITHEFESQTGIPSNINLASSGALARQIAKGAEADLFISANRQWVNWLAEQNKISLQEAFLVCRNHLVMIRPKSHVDQAMPASPLMLLTSDHRLAIGDPQHVPAGRYAEQTLTVLGVWPTVKSGAVLTPDVRSTLLFVERGEADLGFIYLSDAKGSTAVETVWTAPDGLHDPIEYLGVTMPNASPEARRLRDFLCTELAQGILQEYGFIPRETKPPTPTTLTAASAASATRKHNSGIVSALWLSLTVALSSTLVSAIPAVICGWLLARKQFPGRTLLDAFLHVPLVVPPVVVGFGLLMLLGRESWLGSGLEMLFGIRIAFHWLGAVVAAVVMSFPLAVRATRVAFEMIDTRLEEAAATLGKSPRQVFLTVTLPLALPGVAAGMVLALARSLGEFGATITLAGNVAHQTRTLPLATFAEIQSPGGEQTALLLAGVSVTLAIAALIVSELLIHRLRASAETRRA